ncbi:maleylacetoacetate isomerase [Parashewanella curva]|uniref:Maleylacetoacetate isomerase n=1 Tax=Parashewanella curva TaxID=2338552 RepID=A0A3L8Q217_9GAMM|nr:maleylacetoacetate isomerase [Parashewanella curva]RLV61520.1 maleylacetoacetate isomerase [Parashewanella curva]
MKLYGYWRSSAAYRVRIALNLKGLQAEHISVHLVKDGGQQHKPEYIDLNPQELVPTLVIKNTASESELKLTQSLAIIDYLEQVAPDVNLLPKSAASRAVVNSMALLVACDVHPLNNLGILQYLSNELEVSDEQKSAWYHHWIHKGFKALEVLLEQHSGQYCFGDSVTLADVCLIPQVYNAKRFNVPLDDYPNINRIWDNCNQLDSFKMALPENQEDAVI